MEPWTPEREVNEELARRLIEEQFPEVAPKSLVRVGQGFDNVAFEVNGGWVFRFPQRQAAVPLIEHEVAILPELGPTLPLAIPYPEKHGLPSAAFPWPFLGYWKLSGTTVDRAKLSEAQRMAMARPLGELLKALHSFPVAKAADKLPGDDLHRANVAERRERALPLLQELTSAGAISQDASTRLEAILTNTPTRMLPGRAVVHGDLYGRHLLVDAHGNLTGVVDWGDVHIGEIAVDLSIAFIVLPPNARDDFREAYGPVPQASWDFARFRAVYHSLATLRYARKINDAELAAASLLALNQTLI